MRLRGGIQGWIEDNKACQRSTFPAPSETAIEGWLSCLGWGHG